MAQLCVDVDPMVCEEEGEARAAQSQCCDALSCLPFDDLGSCCPDGTMPSDSGCTAG